MFGAIPEVILLFVAATRNLLYAAKLFISICGRTGECNDYSRGYFVYLAAVFVTRSTDAAVLSLLANAFSFADVVVDLNDACHAHRH